MELRSLTLPARRRFIYLKRLLWFLAWGGWAWLGVGLYRELPREVGPKLCSLPLDKGERLCGYWGERQRIVSEETHDDDKPVTLRVWDPETGLPIKRLDGPPPYWRGREYAPLSRHGLVLGTRPRLSGLPEPTGPSVLDVETGEWRDLPVSGNMRWTYPRGKPWAAFYGPLPFNEGEPANILVYDLRTGSLLFSWTDRTRQGEPYEPCDQPLFVGDSLLLIPVRKPTGAGGPGDERLELWSITDNKRLKVLPNIPFDREAKVTPAGRIAWTVTSWSRGAFDVFDVHQERIILSYPKEREPPGNRNEYVPGDADPILGEDGRTLYQSDVNALFDVDTGRVLWELPKDRRWGPIHMREELDRAADETGIVVDESMTLPWVGELKAAAVRRFSTGALLYRYRLASEDHWYVTNKAGTLAYDSATHDIHRWPPQVNWTLLAVCQFILALPLVVLWAILRLRRRRAARFQPLEAAP